jgi:adenylate cyclase
MGEDEAATIRTLTTYREVMTTLIQQHRGRVVDSPGDNLLAEFASAVDAVQGALAIQRALRARNAELPDNHKMAYRIGINVGDVVVEGERIYGDGVNIAARLESLAEGGGLCLAGTVYDQGDAHPEPMPRGSAPGPSGAVAGARRGSRRPLPPPW